MKKFLAVTVLSMSVGSLLAAQGRGPASVGVPANTGTAHNPNIGSLPNPNPGSGKSNAAGDSAKGASASVSGKGSSALDTGGFKNHGQYVAAQHVSENLHIPLDQLKAKMTGNPPESLGKAIHDLTGLPPDKANAEAKKAEAQAKRDSKS
jgi:hypothetical protein